MLACLNGKFLAFDSGFTSLTPDRKILSGVRHQIIYSQSMDCTIVPWESLTSMVISLALVKRYTSMTGNQVVSTMFDFNTCNHMVRFVLWATILKTLDIIFVIQVAREYVYFATHRSTVYVSWLCHLD